MKKQKLFIGKEQPRVTWQHRKNTTEAIPFAYISEDGIADIENNEWSATYELTDINYKKTPQQTQLIVFNQYCRLLNGQTDDCRIQPVILSYPLSSAQNNSYLKPVGNEQTDEVIAEYNKRLDLEMFSDEKFYQEKYITITVTADSLEAARRKLISVENDTFTELVPIQSSLRRLGRNSRLSLLRRIINPADMRNIYIDKDMTVKKGFDGKSLIAPVGSRVERDNYIKMDDWYTRVYSISSIPDELSDTIVEDILGLKAYVRIALNIKPIDPTMAIRTVRKKLNGLDRNAADSIARQAKGAPYALPQVPRELQEQIDNVSSYLAELKAKNEKAFMVNILITLQATSLEELEAQEEGLHRCVNKNDCEIKRFTVGMEDAYNSTLPLGRDDTFVRRNMPTSNVAVFIPFNVLDLIHQDGFVYGQNVLSNNIVKINRKNLQNPHGFFCGQSGGGKSVMAKSEIVECFMRTDDPIIIIDPNGEFVPLTKRLGGQVVDLSADSPTCINPFDISMNYKMRENENPIRAKSDFIITLMDIITKHSIQNDTATSSIIDRCVRQMYKTAEKSNFSPSAMPTMPDFYNILMSQKEDVAHQLAQKIEIYVKGSLDVFSKQTNINMNNRLVCFSTRDLGEQLYPLAMAILQDYVFGQLLKNREKKQNTWLYNDEIHISLRDTATAMWLNQMWKRGRQFGLIATGITQEVLDCAKNEYARSILAISEFAVILHQSEQMLTALDSFVRLTDEQKAKLLVSKSGCGFIKYGSSVLEFDNVYEKEQYPNLFKMYQTDVGK